MDDPKKSGKKSKTLSNSILIRGLLVRVWTTVCLIAKTPFFDELLLLA